MRRFQRLALLLALLSWVGLPVLAEVHPPEPGSARDGESILAALTEIPQAPLLLPGEEPPSTEESSDPGMPAARTAVHLDSVSSRMKGRIASLRPDRSADLLLLLTRRNE